MAINQVDPSALPSLAKQFDLPQSALINLTEPQMRFAVKGALLRKRYAGTPWAVEQALLAHGYDAVRIIEWFEADPPGEPYTFWVEVEFRRSGPVFGDWDGATRIVLEAKNARSYLAGLTVKIVPVVKSQIPRIGSAVVIGEDVLIMPYAILEREIASPWPHAAAMTHGAEIITILPQGA